jgi:hypothetical protein
VARVYEQKGFLEGNPDFGNLQRSILKKVWVRAENEMN